MSSTVEYDSFTKMKLEKLKKRKKSKAQWARKNYKEMAPEKNVESYSDDSLHEMPNQLVTAVENTEIANQYSASGFVTEVELIEFQNSDEDFLLCASSESSDCDGIEDTGSHVESLQEDLRCYHYKHRITRDAMDDLLHLLNKHGVGKHFLPLSCKTLIKTPKDFSQDIRSKSGIEYINLGVESQIKSIFGRYPLNIRDAVDTLVISQNIDGVPFFKSSLCSAWPLLMKIDNIHPQTVFPVVLACGQSKPDNFLYLEEAIAELNSLFETGIQINEKHYAVKLGPIICDAPARAAVKGVSHHNAMYGCDFCSSCGVYDGKRMTWPCTWRLPMRTNESFRERKQACYHKSKCVYEKLPIDMIQNFPIDFMHQAGGAVKKLLWWNLNGPRTAGPLKLPCKMAHLNVQTANRRLKIIKNQLPNAFARKARSFNDIARYKYTELRQILLYTGKIVFMNVMASKAHFENFCTLNVACALLVDDELYKNNIERSESLMKSWADGCLKLYGSAFMVYNIHSMLHLPGVARTHGPLDKVSAWPFENYLGQVKKSVRSGARPIVSLARRWHEENECYKNKILEVPKQRIYDKRPNNTYVDIDKMEFYDIVSIDLPGNKVECVKYLNGKPFFTKPVSSELIGCIKINRKDIQKGFLPLTKVRGFRRAIRIDLDLLPGYSPIICESVFLSLCHNPLY